MGVPNDEHRSRLGMLVFVGYSSRFRPSGVTDRIVCIRQPGADTGLLKEGPREKFRARNLFSHAHSALNRTPEMATYELADTRYINTCADQYTFRQVEGLAKVLRLALCSR